MYRIFLFFVLGSIILLAACRPSVSENEYQIRIQLSEDRKQVVLSNLPVELMEQAKTENYSSTWKDIFAVYEISADPDLSGLEPALPGTYLLNGNQLAFKPETPFKKGIQYEARVLIQSLNMETFGLLQKGKWQAKKDGLRYRFSY